MLFNAKGLKLIPISSSPFATGMFQIWTDCHRYSFVFQIGLIDDAASDKTDAIDKCKNFIKRFDNIPTLARNTTKLRIRQRLLEKMERIRQQDLAGNMEFIQKPEVQLGLEEYMKKLKTKAAKSV
jgi:enoyl-CoA hydratase/carnithine racemase